MLGAISLFFSAFVRHWSFTVVGAAGVLMATVASFGEFGRLAPIAAAVVGLALIYRRPALVEVARVDQGRRAGAHAREGARSGGAPGAVEVPGEPPPASGLA